VTITRFFYTGAMFALLPFALLRLLWRSRRQPEYLRHVGERLGRYPDAAPAHPLIWVHAVSVGETRAAQPLINALLSKYPDYHVLLTHMTPTGRAAGEALFAERVTRCYLPYDFPTAVKRFLTHFRPRLGVIMETELWCNLIHQCHRREIPLYLINARLSEKSLRGYQRFSSLMCETLRKLAGIGAQTAEDAQRLQILGATRVTVTGNLKFDVTPPDAKIELGRIWRAASGTRPVLLAASTRAGEEGLLLDALGMLRPPDTLLVIVPRHPQRFNEVAALVEQRGLNYQRRSVGTSIDAQTQILLGDSMGDMFAYYAACDVAFVGGSLVPVGGQNLIEACVIGKPVIIGPSNYNFADSSDRAVSVGAVKRVTTAAEVMREASRLIADAAAAKQMGDAGRAFTGAHRGATQRALDILTISSSWDRAP
jgi:3-deoxy-D-manno-octulosonic-acid transferase